jgi:hypothetical protein
MKNIKHKYSQLASEGARNIEGFHRYGQLSEGLMPISIIGSGWFIDEEWDKWGYADENFQIVIPLVYDDVQDFSEGLAAVKTGERWGYIDRTGKKIVPAKYADARPFSEGLAAVMLNNKWGFIDKSGNTLIPFRYGGVGMPPDKKTKKKIQTVVGKLKQRVIAEVPDYGEFTEIVESLTVAPFHVVKLSVFMFPEQFRNEYPKEQFDKMRVFEIEEEIPYCKNSKWVTKGDKLKILAALEKMEKDCSGSFVCD